MNSRLSVSDAPEWWLNIHPCASRSGRSCIACMRYDHSYWMAQRKRARRNYRVIRVESWEAFLEHITQPPYSNWAFRGERDERWPLYSSISRYLQNFSVARAAWPEQEARILRIFKRKAHQFLDKPPHADDDFQWLALMQHHGAPTRLIDFSLAPYVAAF